VYKTEGTWIASSGGNLIANAVTTVSRGLSSSSQSAVQISLHSSIVQVYDLLERDKERYAFNELLDIEPLTHIHKDNHVRSMDAMMQTHVITAGFLDDQRAGVSQLKVISQSRFPGAINERSRCQIAVNRLFIRWSRYAEQCNSHV
jgi:hypothetical protein